MIHWRKDYMKSYNEVYDCIEPKLDQLGKVNFAQLWDFGVKNLPTGNKTTKRRKFNTIMMTMVEQGKAVKLGDSYYEILKPNRKQRNEHIPI